MCRRLLSIFHLLLFAGLWSLTPPARAVIFTWDPSPDPSVVAYGVYYSTEPFYNPHATNDLGVSFTHSLLVGSDTSAGLFGLLPDETYYLSVTAFDTNGVESDPSNLAVFNPSFPLPPRYFTNANGTVRLTWDARPDPLEPFRTAQSVLFYNTRPFTPNALLDNTWTALSTLSVGRQTNVVLANLATGQNYYFAVAAYDSNNVISDLSNVSELTIPAPPAPLCVVDARGDIAVSWDPRPNRGKPGTVAGYNIYYSQDPFDLDSVGRTNDAPVLWINVGTKTSVTFTNLTLNQPYYFAVATYDRKETVTDLSDLAEFMTPSFNSRSDPRPLPPVALSVSASGWNSITPNGIITATWGPSPDPGITADVAGYILYYSTNFFSDLSNLSQNDRSVLQAIPFKKQTTAVLSGLSPGRTYYFGVAAYSSNHTIGELSNIAATTTTPNSISSIPPPAAPTSLTVGTQEGNLTNLVRIAWQASPSAIGYNLYYETRSGPINVLPVPGETSVTLTNLIPGFNYYFAITAYDSNGIQSALSDSATFTFPDKFDLSPQLPGVTVSSRNGVPILTIRGTLGADLIIQSSVNPYGSAGWSSISEITLSRRRDDSHQRLYS